LQNKEITISDLKAPVFKYEIFVVQTRSKWISIRSLREAERSSRSTDSNAWDAPPEGDNPPDKAWAYADGADTVASEWGSIGHEDGDHKGGVDLDT